MTSAGDERDAVGHLLRDLAPRVLAAVARRHDDFAAAEDAVQDAMIAAAEQWSVNGVPANPAGWLYHVATRRITDHVRSEIARRRREAIGDSVWAEWAFVPAVDATIDAEEDDTLTLLFMCCHPSLTPPSAIALTLRAVGGLTTAEIASAFLVPEATMAQRISRAKLSVKNSNVGFELPGVAERDARLGSVMHVLYLIFNEGYASASGDALVRVDLSNEAIRLTRMLVAAVPTSSEALGLLALMLLTDARRSARSGASGELIPLDEQDRSLWDRALVDEGTLLVSRAMAAGAIGAYQIQAAIAALHDAADRYEHTDWQQIELLYDALMALTDNPMVALNHAIAVSMVRGADAGLSIIAELAADERIKGHYRLDAVRGHLYELAGDRERAIRHFAAAAEKTASQPERDYLRLKAARLAHDTFEADRA